MAKKEQKQSFVNATEPSQLTHFLGVEFRVLLPRERSECLEVLLERYPKGLAFPIHQHKECEQMYLILEGEAEIHLSGKSHKVGKGGVVYIPRQTDHAVKNIGDSELMYVVVEAYPDGYLPNEPTWNAHMKVLRHKYGKETQGKQSGSL